MNALRWIKPPREPSQGNLGEAGFFRGTKGLIIPAVRLCLDLSDAPVGLFLHKSREKTRLSVKSIQTDRRSRNKLPVVWSRWNHNQSNSSEYVKSSSRRVTNYCTVPCCARVWLPIVPQTPNAGSFSPRFFLSAKKKRHGHISNTRPFFLS